MQEGRRGRDVDPVCTELRDRLFSHSLSGFQVGLPDVPSGNDTELKVDLGALERSNNLVDLFGLSIDIEVQGVDWKSLQEVDALSDSAVRRGDGDMGCNRSESLVDLLVLRCPSLGFVHDEDRLIDLYVLDTGALELSQKLSVNGDELVE